MEGFGGAPAGADSEDPTGVGGGNIGTGNVPQPGEASFSTPDTGPTGATE